MTEREWENVFSDEQSGDDFTRFKCHYCFDEATTMRQGAAVCAFHANALRNVGWA